MYQFCRIRVQAYRKQVACMLATSADMRQELTALPYGGAHSKSIFRHVELGYHLRQVYWNEQNIVCRLLGTGRHIRVAHKIEPRNYYGAYWFCFHYPIGTLPEQLHSTILRTPKLPENTHKPMETNFHPPLTLVSLLATYPHSHYSPPSLGVPPIHTPF